MPDLSPRLGLPLLMPAQAQKHVTHNAALLRLELLVQTVLEAVAAAAPPALPEAGQTWALGPAPTGAWAGQAGNLATWRDGGWSFAAPAEGWLAWDRAAGQVRAFDGAAWIGLAQALDLADLDRLGIGASPDATNRLAVAAPAVLLSHAGAGHQLKLNKAAAGDTGTLLFQTGFSGRAEMGLAGSDGFSVKVSADGSGWTTALSLDPATGAAALAAGASIGGAAAYHRGNLVGTAALAGGLPAGAALERGETADGSYLRLADGTQICWHEAPALAATAAAGALWSNGADQAWTFPMPFADPAVSCAGAAGSALQWLGFGAPSASAVSYRLLSAQSDATARPPRLLAVGRWA